MVKKNEVSLILLTYKGKVLLLFHRKSPIDESIKAWRFIGTGKDQQKSFEESIRDEVERETGLKLNTVKLLSNIEHKDRIYYLYHGQLTDRDVNEIARKEGQLLEFFTLKEIEKLQLATTTKLFVSKHQDLLKKIPHFT